MAERADPILALIGGISLGLAGFFGLVTADKLAAATLVVLSVVGFSLLRERSLRLKANKTSDEIRTLVINAHNAIEAIRCAEPYTVLVDDAVWDILAQDGSLARSTRTKRLRFEQNDVIALHDWSQRDGEVERLVYTPGTKVDTFRTDGKEFSLISLGRFYSQGEEVDFKVERTVRNTFCSPKEVVSVETRDRTTKLSMTVRWPEGCSPDAVRLKRISSEGERSIETITHMVKDEDGRATVTVIKEPERRDVTTIEWDWQPATESEREAHRD